MGNSVFAVNKNTMTQIWKYTANSPVHTPPAYSPSRDRVVVVTQDLYVHAIDG
jgi:outer membrane protein assembly factor BamB